MAKLIGTVGHVDHGKTSLIQALTGINPDRLPEEQQRGMTIDLGFASIDLNGDQVSIVDVPGHERYLENMLVGALGIDIALLCVAADSSVMPQTRDHLRIIDLLPVHGLVVALTRADLADESLLEIVRAEVNELLAPTRFKDSPLVPVSSLTGEGIEALKTELAAALKAESKPKEGIWWLPIDRCFNLTGQGLIVTGTLIQGLVEANQAAVIQPGNHEVKVRGVQTHSKQTERAEFGQRVALNLTGIKLEEVHRGQAIGAAGALFETQCLELAMRWLRRPKHGERLRMSVGSDEVIGRIFFDREDESYTQIRLERSVAAARGASVIVRKYSPPFVYGGGTVAVPLAQPRRKVQSADTIEHALADAPQGLSTAEVARRLGKPADQITGDFERLKSEGKILGFAGHWLTPPHFAEVQKAIQTSLEEIHKEHPARASHPIAQVFKRAGLTLAEKPMLRVVSALAEEGHLKCAGSEIALTHFKVTLNARQEELMQRIEAELQKGFPNVPSPAQMASELRIPLPAVTEILSVGGQAQRLIRLTPEIFYTSAQVQDLQMRLKSLPNPFSIADFREKIGTSRKYAVPILEYFDARRITVRQGDARRLT